MAARIVAILIVIGLGGFVWWTNYKVSNPPAPPNVNQAPKYVDPDAASKGVEPDSPPEHNVDVELRFEGEKAFIDFTISEAHGWYTDHMYIDFWYVRQDDNGDWHQVGDPVRYMCHNYLKFGETLVEYTTLYDLEFPELDVDDGGRVDWGTAENWRARVGEYGQVLAPKP